MSNSFWRKTKARLVRFLRGFAVGTIVAFIVLYLTPLLKHASDLAKSYLQFPLPTHANSEITAALCFLFLIALLTRLPIRIWHSLKLGLIPIEDWAWVPTAFVFWIAVELNHLTIAWASIILSVIVIATTVLIAQSPRKTLNVRTSLIESDLPLAEDGEDLLGRREIIDGLVARILYEEPSVIALTGGYGEGKTSLLNLTLGELKKLEWNRVPIIVRFSPWLAADSNSLVLSLLDSIVAEIKVQFVVPGINRDAARYAATLLSSVPKLEHLKGLFTDTSQDQRISALAEYIARIRHRVLVVLDDLDRMQPQELETVFKVLRGSDKLSNLTFLCSFDRNELAAILKVTRPEQDTGKFIEKFFPVEIPIPKMDSGNFRDVVFGKIQSFVADHESLPGEELHKIVDDIWQEGAGQYLTNLRRVKLFLNGIGHSFEQIASEVNIGDFLRLELVRAIAPNVYEQIYRERHYFWNRDLAFEVAFTGKRVLDEKAEKQVRAKFYAALMDGVPEDKRFVFELVAGLFPHYAEYQGKYGIKPISNVEAERTKRIFHPRCFAQYFEFKVPQQLFSQKEFQVFLSSLRHADEETAARAFSKIFRSITREDFKRWHFVHLIENRWEDFELPAARGLCRALASNSSCWQIDAFELSSAIEVTGKTLAKINDSVSRRIFLRSILKDSKSTMYSLALIRRLEDMLKDPLQGERFRALGFGTQQTKISADLLSDLQEMKPLLSEILRQHYLTEGAPSVYEEFDHLGVPNTRIEPNAVLFGWRNLGPEAESDQRKYLIDLFTTHPQNLNRFLNLMFRADFLYNEDYSALKALIDYQALADLIGKNEAILDPDKVAEFKKRFTAENPPSAQGEAAS